MAQEITNFARFYAALSKLPYKGEREEIKKMMVSQYTGGRTESLKEMTAKEYYACCNEMDRINGRRDALRKKRSTCLHLMQQMGIDTTDWARIDNLCRHPRIAGKAFSQISPAGLDELQVKLRAIQRKGGFSQKETEGNSNMTFLIIRNNNTIEA